MASIMPSSSELFDSGVSISLQKNPNLFVMPVITIFEDADDARDLHSPKPTQHSNIRSRRLNPGAPFKT
jgi:hypothetical protein